MTAKFKLEAAPTFDAVVDIPVHGAEPAKVKFTFRHRTRDELDAFYKAAGERTVDESVLAVVAGWELDDELNAESVAKLTQNYMGAGPAITNAYINAMLQARLGN